MNEIKPDHTQSTASYVGRHGLRAAWAVMTHRSFSWFKVFIAREHRTVVVLNPKVGTTTFRNVVQRAYREVLGHRNLSNGLYRSIKKAREFPIPPPWDYIHAFSHSEQYNFYCFVRNPYSRLKSAWLDKLALGHETAYPPSIRGKVISRIRHFARDHDLPGQEEGSAVPFATFVAYVAAPTTGKRNHHWDEQYSILLMDCILYSQVFKMETQFAEGTKQILARLGVPESWTEEVLAKPINQSPKITQEVYTAELAAQVQRAFARDFAVLGYDADSWRGM